MAGIVDLGPTQGQKGSARVVRRPKGVGQLAVGFPRGDMVIPFVFKVVFRFSLVHPFSEGPRGASGLTFSLRNRWFWADSGPDPEGNVF